MRTLLRNPAYVRYKEDEETLHILILVSSHLLHWSDGKVIKQIPLRTSDSLQQNKQEFDILNPVYIVH